LDLVRVPLTEKGIAVEVFDGGQAEPVLELAEACHQVAARFGPDAVLGLGGGSNMDVAKLTAVLLTHGGAPPPSLPPHPLPRAPPAAPAARAGGWRSAGARPPPALVRRCPPRAPSPTPPAR